MVDTEKREILDTFFCPKSMAVIGASENPNAFGTRYLEALLKFGYKGQLVAINPGGSEVLGVKIYPGVMDVPDAVDLAVVSVPARIVPAVLKDCLKKKIKTAVVLSSGFSELNEGGRGLEEELIQISRQGIRIIGPNCFGVYCPKGGLTIIPGSSFPRESGSAALLAQSGQFSEMIVLRSMGEGIRFSKVVSYGNACDINETDLLEYLAGDAETKMVLAYIEGVKDGRRFLETVRRISRTKPVVIWKAGLTRSGSVAARSHTGSLAGESRVWEAFFRQSGAIQVSSEDELIDVAIAFTCWPSGCGSQIGLVSGGGGGAVIGADACELSGLSTPPLFKETQDKLASMIPGIGSCVRNPIDIANPIPPPQLLAPVLETVARSDQIDAILIRRIFLSVKASKAVVGYSSVSDLEEKQLMDIPLKISEQFHKPLAIVLSEEMTGSDRIEYEAERRKLRDYYFAGGIPVYPSLVRAVKAIAHVAKYTERFRSVSEKSSS